MLARDLAELTKPDFVVFNDFLAVCGYHHKTTIILSKFLWWARVTEDQHPERNGWFFQTGKRMLQELGITRRGYEKAREILVGLGILEYKRAGVFAKMHWRVNVSKLYEQLFQIRGIAAPVFESNLHTDKDGFAVPKFIPLPLWHDYLKMRETKTGKLTSAQAKRRTVRELEALQKAGEDIEYRLAYNTHKQWLVFKPFATHSPAPAPSGSLNTPSKDDLLKQQVAERRRGDEAIAAARESPQSPITASIRRTLLSTAKGHR